MIFFWRLIFSLIIAFSMMFVTPHAHSLTVANSEITANDLFKLGVNQMQQENYQAAIEYLNLAIKMQNEFIAAYKNRCLAYLQLQDYPEAIADCSQVLNLAPDDSEAYLNRGLAQYRQENYVDAIADYNQALALKPDDFRVYYNRGIAFAEQGDYAQAIIDYNRALSEITPHDNLLLADIYNDRGLAYFELQNLPEAMNNFNLAIDLNSDDDRAYFNRGCICGRSGDNLGAKYDFSQVIRLNPSNAQAYLNRGIANYNLGYYQRAIADLETASEYFRKQEQTLAYRKTLDLLKIVQQEISSTLEIA
ncbi:MAG: tetratricopeptide repeat protein [Nostocales cyanobacterium]|nr:MAG: tetratricopeptide repeat protein [Nostocales cyanobacterium]